MAEPPRRFPSPWRADKTPGGYVVRDATGQSLAYVYSRGNEAADAPHQMRYGWRGRAAEPERTAAAGEPDRAAMAAKLISGAGRKTITRWWMQPT
jgi:hypothetical protein